MIIITTDKEITSQYLLPVFLWELKRKQHTPRNKNYKSMFDKVQEIGCLP